MTTIRKRIRSARSTTSLLLLILFIIAFSSAWHKSKGQPFPEGEPCEPGGPVVTIGNVLICAGALSADIPVSVTSFNNIGSMSLVLNYVPSQLGSPELRSSHPGLWLNFVVNTNTPGVIIVSGYGSGIFIPDHDTIFTLQFKSSVAITDGVISFFENEQGTSCECIPDDPPLFTPFCDTPPEVYYKPGGTFRDNQPPVIYCPPAVTVKPNGAGCKATGVDLGTPTVSDNCGIATGYPVNDAPAEFSPGSHVVTWTVLDLNGLSATCEQAVDVENDVTATITGNANLCQNGPQPAIAFTGSGGEPPYLFSYRINDGDDLQVASDPLKTAAIWQETSIAGSFVYNLLSVTDSNGCVNPVAGSATIVIDPNTSGGSVSGGGDVCSGNNNTILTLVGHTGSVQIWQSSTDGEFWTDLPGETNTTYAATDLTTNTYFRATVQSGECGLVGSEPALLTMLANSSISGFIKYDNNPKTPLDGLSVTLKQGGAIIAPPYTTGPTGYFHFGGLPNGIYDLEIASANPAGWQTWGGVNNTDYLLVSRHVSGVTLLPADPPVVRVTANVKLSNMLINNADELAIRKASKFGWGNPAPFFDIPKWGFSGQTASSSINGISLNCNNVTRDIYGLCAGDVNGSFVPQTGNKSAGFEDEMSLKLINRGTLPVTPEIIFPIRAENDLELGAITLYLRFDTTLLHITGVEMPGAGDEEPCYSVRGNELYVGWSSLHPFRVASNATMLAIRTLLKRDRPLTGAPPEIAGDIRFTLSRNPLSELADAEGNVLENIKLSIAEAKAGSPETENMLRVYPNPASGALFMEYFMQQDGLFGAELFSLQGKEVAVIRKKNSPAGFQKSRMNLTNLANGAYLLKVSCGDILRTVKIFIINIP